MARRGLAAACVVAMAAAFVGPVHMTELRRRPVALAAAVEEPVVEATTSAAEEKPKAVEETPPLPPVVAAASLESDVGADYVPLMSALRERDFEKADQVTRDLLIEVAGSEASERGYVYWTEARELPVADLATIENLWNFYSDGKFGYTVQKDVWRRQSGVFDAFCRKLGWTTTDRETGLERKRRWFGKSEFNYSLDAPKGHLPLTSALRGTQLLKALLQHKAWDSEWKRELEVVDDQ